MFVRWVAAELFHAYGHYEAYFRNFEKAPKNGIKLYPTVKENLALIYFWSKVFSDVVSSLYYTASTGGSIKD